MLDDLVDILIELYTGTLCSFVTVQTNLLILRLMQFLQEAPGTAAVAEVSRDISVKCLSAMVAATRLY